MPDEMDEARPDHHSSSVLTLACLCSTPLSVLMLCVGIDSMSMCPAERRVSYFLVFQALAWLTVCCLRVLVHLIERRRTNQVPCLGMICSVAYTLFSFSCLWAVKFTPAILTLQPDFHDPRHTAHCPAFVFYLTLVYCSLVTFLVGGLVTVVLLGVLAGLLHPDFLVTTGFLKPENVLLDFLATEEEEEMETREAASNLDDLARKNMEPLSPSWDNAGLSPVLGLRSRTDKTKNTMSLDKTSLEKVDKAKTLLDSQIEAGLQRLEDTLAGTLTGVSRGNNYLRTALANSTREERKLRDR